MGRRRSWGEGAWAPGPPPRGRPGAPSPAARRRRRRSGRPRCRALAEVEDVRGFAEFVLDKRVPVAGGLGGGSADAASALRVLNDLWSLGLARGRLQEIAATVGSDVPALVAGGAVLARGRGERV